MDLSVQTISQNLCVDVSTVRRTCDLFVETQSVDKQPYPDSHRLQRRKLKETDQYLILELVLEHPGIYLDELKQKLSEINGTEASTATICRFLHACGLSRTKIRSVALQRNEETRARYIAEVTMYYRRMFIFVDETGCDRRDAMRRFGYSLRGQRCVAKRLLVRGERVSSVTAMTQKGILDYKFVIGTTNGSLFLNFVEQNLLPHLMPFDGNNSNCIVVMDNASIHHSTEVASLVSSVGALLIYLPPYSPDLNPIEEAFSSIKLYMKAHESVVHDTKDIEMVLTAAFMNITEKDCNGWFTDSGYN